MENLSWTEMRKAIPGYRGSKANFPAALKRKQAQKDKSAEVSDDKASASWADQSAHLVTKPSTSKKQPAANLPKPSQITANAAKPTPQKDEAIYDTAIFSADISRRVLHPQTEFTPSAQRFPALVSDTYKRLVTDDPRLPRMLTKEMLSYYGIACLWARLIDIKARREHTPLTEVEREFHRFFKTKTYAIPQPLLIYLRTWGHFRDQRGNLLYLADHTLPVTVVGGRTGYHSNRITAQNHNLYEELPCLGVAGDVLQAVAQRVAGAVPAIPVLPPHTAASPNLLGFTGPIPLYKEEISTTLDSYGITPNQFNEFLATTRLNVQLLNYVSNILAATSTFKINMVNITDLGTEGTEAQLVTSKPRDDNMLGTLCHDCIVEIRSPSATTDTIMGVAFIFGMQLYKEPFGGEHSSWVCVQPAPEQVWNVPEAWIENRNERRVLPQNYRHDESASVPDSQVTRTENVMSKLVVTPR